jgi:FtsP/CotA-like multicopper oxidase with cupredoxin domain
MLGMQWPVRLFAQDPSFEPDVELHLTASHRQVPILGRRLTDVWSYQGEILKGTDANLVSLPDTYLGPIIRVKTEQKLRIRFTNTISEESIIHWHGLYAPESADGHPRLVIPEGHTYVYEFEVKNRAGTYWFHPHPHGRTGPQTYFGMAGLFIVEDDEEHALNLPSGEYDLPLVIQDRRFNTDGSLQYITSQMDRMQGFLGDVMLVNGQPDATIPVKTGLYRLRLLNGSNSRIYKLYLSDGSDFTVIGTDGGLLRAPVKRPFLVLGPAERVDLLIDFSTYPMGSMLQLRSMPFEGGFAGMGGMMGGMRRGMSGNMRNSMMAGGLVNGGQDLQIAEFRIAGEGQSPVRIPERLSTVNPPDVNEAINAGTPRQFVFEMQMMQPVINGRVFEMDGVADDEVVRLNTTEIWEVINRPGHMAMPHPVHVHNIQFRILERSGAPQEFQAGYVDEGWKDSVLLMPEESAKLLLRFEHYAGLYLYHCHNLEHEDLGMMRNYRIAA